MPGARTTPNLFITIPPNPITSTHQKHIESTISSPKTPYSSHCCRLTTRQLLRIFPWVVGCTLVLWIFVLRADTPPLRLYSPQQHPPVEGYRSRPSHPPHRHSKSHASSSKLTVWGERAVNVQSSFIHAYNGYRQYAALCDVLLPVRAEGANNLNGWGLTLYDSLDTMWIMGLHDMFRESLGTIARASFSLQIREHEYLYNTVLHHLGGLLSAYALSKESLLLTRADDLGKILLPAFNSSSAIHSSLTSKESSMEQNMTSVSWAAILSHQLEFKYLAHLTGRIEYYKLTRNFMEIHDVKITNNSAPNRWEVASSSINNGHYDSAQEYFLKQWLLTARSDSRSLALYLDSIGFIIETQLYISPNRNLLYLTNLSPFNSSYVPTHRFHHHSCSFPALLALGVHNLGISLPLRDRELHLWAAQGLAYTCWVMYADQGSGLGGEEVKMRFGDGSGMEFSTGGEGGGKASRWMELVEEWEEKGKKGNGPPGTRENEIYVTTSTASEDRDYVLLRTGYALNPDLIESFYFLWKITKSERWRNRGWAIFEAIEKHTRTKHGYANLVNVEEIPSLMKDEMPSYFLGETLKYLYLLFSDDEPLALNSWVFNSRGHPLPVFDWSIWEKERFNITV